MIDNRKCWFRGRVSMDKKLLYWSRAVDVKQTTVNEQVDTLVRTRGSEQDDGPVRTMNYDRFNQTWRDMLIDMAAPWWRNRKPVQQWGLEP